MATSQFKSYYTRFLIMFSVAFGATSGAMLGKKYINECFVDEIFYPAPQETALEEKLGKPIYLNWNDFGEIRARKVMDLNKMYQKAALYWDNLHQQFTVPSSIEFEETTTTM